MSRLLAYGIEIFSLQNLEVFFLIPNFRVKQVTYSTLLWFERSLGCALPSTVAMRPEVHQPAFIVLHVCNIFTSVKIHVRLLDVLASIFGAFYRPDANWANMGGVACIL